MEQQIETPKYTLQGHSHDHLYRLLEKLDLPMENVALEHHHAHSHEQELSYCPLFRGMSQKEHDDFLDRNVREVLTFEKGETVVRQGDPRSEERRVGKGCGAWWSPEREKNE